MNLRLAAFALPTLATLAVGASAADQFTLDPVHSFALFKVQHFGAGISVGRFDTAGGTLTWDAADASKNAITVTIQADSVSTGSDEASKKRDGHLKAADFLSAKEFPTLSFKSKSFTKVDDATFKVDGDFTLRGKTKPLSITVKKTGQGKLPAAMGGKDVVGFETVFTISRKDFGMEYGAGAVGDAVTIEFYTEANK